MRALRIALTGIGSHTGCSVLASLRTSLPEAWVLGLDARPEAAALFACDARSLVPPLSQKEAYLEALVGLVLRYRLDALIPCLDRELLLLAQERGRFEALGCTVVVAEPEVIRICRSKRATAERLRSAGLPFAETWTLEEAARRWDTVPFPCLAKPDQGSGSRGIQVLKAGAPWPEGPGDWAVQVLLQGAGDPPLDGSGSQRDCEELSFQGVVAPTGQVAGLFLGRTRKDRGISLMHAPLLHPEAAEPARAILGVLASLGLRGPCNLQGRWTAEGPCFFEVNPRFTGGTAARTVLGFEEVWASLALLQAGWPVDQVRPRLGCREDLVCLKHMCETGVPLAELQALDSAER